MRRTRRVANPQATMVAGVILALMAILIGITAWGGIVLLQGSPDPTETGVIQPTAVVGGAVTPSAGIPPEPTAFPPPFGQSTLVSGITPAPTIPSALPPLASPVPSQVDVEQLLASMTLEEKIGQMIMAGISGQTLTPDTAGLIQNYHFGSVVYFGENTQNPAQTLGLSNGLQQTAAGGPHAIPLLIAVDHEGGRVFRFRQGLTHFPNPMTLGAAGSDELTLRIAAANAQELKAVGINLDLGPVLDVNDQPLNPVIGLRAFGGFSDLVARTGVAYIRGLQGSGVIAAGKHFPGHGSTTVDSHETLPQVSKDLDSLRMNELVPFQRAIDAGVGMIMVGHIAFPEIDKTGEPASLSPVFIDSLLRGEMKFDGVVMTDALSMGAIEGGYSLGEAAERSVLAGCDILAYNGPQAAVSAHNLLVSAVRSGRIPEERINQAARRVLELKRRFGLFNAPISNGQFDQAASQALARQLALQAVTLQGNAAAPLISTNRVLLVTPDVLSKGSTPGDGYSLLGELLQARDLEVDEWIYAVDDAGDIATRQAQALQALANYPLGIVVTWDAVLGQGQGGGAAQMRMAQALQAGGKPVILIAASSPYDLSLVQPGGVGLATYGALDYQIEALVEALFAQILPTGKLPVAVSIP